MKKLVLMIMLMLSCIAAKGQTFDINGIPTHSIDITVADGSGEALVGIFVDAIAATAKAVFGQDSNSEIVGWTPYVSVTYMYHFPGTRWSVGPDVGYWHMGIRDNETLSTIHMNTATLAASGRFYYKPYGVCKLYGNAYAGAGVFISGSDASIVPAVQLNPIGMRLGNEDIAFVAELGVGYKGILQLGAEISF